MDVELDNITVIDIDDYKVLVSNINGNRFIIPDNYFYYFDPLELEGALDERGAYNEINYSLKDIEENLNIINISLNPTSACNLACKYCFKSEKSASFLTLEKATKFIDYMVDLYPKAEKYFVDLTGSGEPLLVLPTILQINEHCKQKANEIGKEVLVMLASNGVLLNKDTAETLQKEGILFGISIDGDKKAHDANRVDKNNFGTYDRIIENIKNIEHRDFIGAAATLTNDNTNILQTFLHLHNFFPTVSIKPARLADSNLDVEEIKDYYTDFYEFLLRHTLKGNTDYLFAILNGDDYFAKFLMRIINNEKVVSRCDAAIRRFSLAPNDKIYACPASVDIDLMEIGDIDNGIDFEKSRKIWNTLNDRKKCNGCPAKYFCGGECLAVSYYYSKKLDKLDPDMCNLKRHLFTLAVKFESYLLTKKPEMIELIKKQCATINSRYRGDSELRQAFEKLKHKFTFAELKKIKDENYQKFKELNA